MTGKKDSSEKQFEAEAVVTTDADNAKPLPHFADRTVFGVAEVPDWYDSEWP